MKIALKSDLHLEFFRGNVYKPAWHGEQVLILAGDVDVGLENHVWFADLLQHRHVIYVLGNHEFYKHDMPRLLAAIPDFQQQVMQLARSLGHQHDLHVLENASVVIDDVEFMGATLWTDFDGGNADLMQRAPRYMSDFRIIDHGDHVVTAQNILDHHVASRDWLHAAVQASQARRRVLITHHLPSWSCIHPRWQSPPHNGSNGYFASACDDLVMKFDLAVHGHTHDSIDACIGSTPVRCNPRGYRHEVNAGFQEDLIIDLP